MGSKSIGIYIDKSDIYIVALNKSMGKVVVETADKADIPDSEDRDKAISITLRALVSKHNIKDQAITVGVGTEDAVVRYFEMPPLSRAQQTSAVPLAARKYLPFKIEDTQSDFTVTYEGVTPGNMAVQFLACEKTTLERYIAILQDAGLKLENLEPAPFALRRLFDYAQVKGAKEAMALIGVGSGSASINLFRGSTLYLTRNVAPVPETLANELQLSFDYLHRQFPNLNALRIFVCADEELEKWTEGLSSEFNIESHLINPLNVIEGAKKYSADFAVAFGLALKKFHDIYAGLSISPRKEAQGSRDVFKLTAVCVITGLLVLSGLQLGVSKKISGLQHRLRQTVAQRDGFQKEIAGFSLNQLEALRAAQGKQLKHSQELIDERLSITEKLNRLNTLVPDEIWLTNVSFQSKRARSRTSRPQQYLQISGLAYNASGTGHINMINQFLTRLKQDEEFSKDFEEIKLESASRDQLKEHRDYEVTGFRIQCRI